MGNLPEDVNKKYILENCLTCHSSSYIEEQRLSRNQWDKTIVWMEEKHNLKIKESKVREKILDYLENYFSPAKTKETVQRPVNPLPIND